MKRRSFSITCAGLMTVFACFAPTSAFASAAISADAGTTGLGGTLWVTASPEFVLSVGYGALDLSPDYSTDGVDYTSDFDLSNVSALARWHPKGGSFNLAGGLVWADNSVLVTGEPGPGNTYEIDGQTYTAAEVGSLTGVADFGDDMVPYVGIGWSKRPVGEGLGLYLDLGVMFSGSADARLSASGPIATDPTFQDRLAAEEQDLNDELSSVEVYPVVRAGLMFRF